MTREDYKKALAMMRAIWRATNDEKALRAAAYGITSIYYPYHLCMDNETFYARTKFKAHLMDLYKPTTTDDIPF